MSKKILRALCVFIVLAMLSAITNSIAQEDPKEAARRAALMGKAVQVLTSKQWTIYVTVAPAAAQRAAVVETDTLTFTDRTVLSNIVSSKEYAKNGSNYSLFIQDNTTVVWETMQMHANEKDIAFLKGELNLNSGVMQGVIVYKPSRGKGESYSYSTLRPGEAVPIATFKPVVVPEPTVTTEKAKETKEPRKEKRGWW